MPLRFTKQTEKVGTRRQKGEGLSADGSTVRIKGNKKGTKKVGAKGKAVGKGKGKQSNANAKAKDGGGSLLRPPRDIIKQMASDSRLDADDVSEVSTASSFGSGSAGSDIHVSGFGRSDSMGKTGGTIGGNTLSNMGSGKGPVSSSSSRSKAKPAMVASDENNEDFDSDDESSVFSSVSGSGSFISSISSASSISVPRDKTLQGLGRKNAPKKSSSGFELSPEEEEEAERQDILARLHMLKQRGVRLSKNYTPKSTLAELRMEIGRIEHETETSRSVQRLRRWLLMLASGAQWATNSKYAPRMTKGKLNGFSKYVMNSIEDYDPAFEAMSERYGGVIGIGSSGNPLVDVALLFVMQMFLFVFYEHHASVKPPTEDEVRTKYPELVERLANERVNKILQERESGRNLEEEREAMRQKWVRDFQSKAPPAMPPPPVVPGLDALQAQLRQQRDEQARVQAQLQMQQAQMQAQMQSQMQAQMQAQHVQERMQAEARAHLQAQQSLQNRAREVEKEREDPVYYQEDGYDDDDEDSINVNLDINTEDGRIREMMQHNQSMLDLDSSSERPSMGLPERMEDKVAAIQAGIEAMAIDDTMHRMQDAFMVGGVLDDMDDGLSVPVTTRAGREVSVHDVPSEPPSNLKTPVTEKAKGKAKKETDKGKKVLNL